MLTQEERNKLAENIEEMYDSDKMKRILRDELPDEMLSKLEELLYTIGV